MPVLLRPIDESALPAYIDRAREAYERQMIDLGELDPDEASARAGADTERLFPAGRPAENVHLFEIVDEETGAVAGSIFFASIRRGAREIAFVYGLDIDESFRRRGLGRSAMLAAEEKARDLGLEEIRLHVFGRNEPARSLYRSLGYEEVDATMTKPLS